MHYPETRRDSLVEEKFGTSIADPYRWLEKDVRTDTDVAGWVDSQNDLAEAYLSKLPGRPTFHERLAMLYDHERPSTPVKRGNRYFFTRSSGLHIQPLLLLREGPDNKERVLVDPAEWSQTGTKAFAEWAPSEDGRHVVLAIQENGTDWRTLRVMDVDSGAYLEDEIFWARFTSIAWLPDGCGFFYTRNPAPKEGSSSTAPVKDHAVYFHRLGTPQAEDRLIHAPQSSLPLIHTVECTHDGRYVVIYTSALQGGSAISVVELSEHEWTVRPIFERFDTLWLLAGNVGSKLYLVTQLGAERGRLVTLDLNDADAKFEDLVPESDDRVLRFASLIGDRLIVSYALDAKTEVERFCLDGTSEGPVPLPGIGTAGPFQGRPGDNESFYMFTSYDTPTSIHRYDACTNTSTVWATPEVKFARDRIRVEQHFYSSKDGTRVPMFVIRDPNVPGPAPTLLTAYGGFGISVVPFFMPDAVAWVEQGGVYAIASIRGGGEYGKAWHDGGRLSQKQNSFDDFIAAAEFLKDTGIATPDGIAIHGESNGGLLIGAVVNQRPDLFVAALPGVGVFDMLRFEEFTGGLLWSQEFGSPSVEADFRCLAGYSPLHNIKHNVSYPAILATTADADDRVVPGHSFKYVAALQAAEIGDRPHILRVETEAGHGMGKPIDKVINEAASRWAFAAHWTGLEVFPRD